MLTYQTSLILLIYPMNEQHVALAPLTLLTREDTQERVKARRQPCCLVTLRSNAENECVFSELLSTVQTQLAQHMMY